VMLHQLGFSSLLTDDFLAETSWQTVKLATLARRGTKNPTRALGATTAPPSQRVCGSTEKKRRKKKVCHTIIMWHITPFARWFSPRGRERK
jgi:hypothetical protein